MSERGTADEKQWRSIFLAGGLIVAGAGTATAIAAAAQIGPFEAPSHSGPEPTAEHVSASSNGVVLTIVSATFSGTETMLDVSWSAPGVSGVRDLTIPVDGIPEPEQLAGQAPAIRSGDRSPGA